jgi:hypothetical protein
MSGLVSCGDAPSVEPQLKPRLVYVDSVDLDKSAVPDGYRVELIERS